MSRRSIKAEHDVELHFLPIVTFTTDKTITHLLAGNNYHSIWNPGCHNTYNLPMMAFILEQLRIDDAKALINNTTLSMVDAPQSNLANLLAHVWNTHRKLLEMDVAADVLMPIVNFGYDIRHIFSLWFNTSIILHRRPSGLFDDVFSNNYLHYQRGVEVYDNVTKFLPSETPYERTTF